MKKYLKIVADIGINTPKKGLCIQITWQQEYWWCSTLSYLCRKWRYHSVLCYQCISV